MILVQRTAIHTGDGQEVGAGIPAGTDADGSIRFGQRRAGRTVLEGIPGEGDRCRGLAGVGIEGRRGEAEALVVEHQPVEVVCPVAAVDRCQRDAVEQEVVDQCLIGRAAFDDAFDADRRDLLAGSDFAEQPGKSRREKQVDRQGLEVRGTGVPRLVGWSHQRADIEGEVVSDRKGADVTRGLRAAVQTVDGQVVGQGHVTFPRRKSVDADRPHGVHPAKRRSACVGKRVMTLCLGRYRNILMSFTSSCSAPCGSGSRRSVGRGRIGTHEARPARMPDNPAQ